MRWRRPDLPDLSFDFSGRRALVIGGSRGIGRGLTQRFLETGAEVIYASRTEGSGLQGATFVPCDLQDADSTLDLFRTVDASGDLHFMVNMAATNYFHKVSEIEPAEWDEVLSVNLRAAYLACREAGKRMMPRKFGRIINISSIAGRHRSPVSGAHYSASKAGLLGLTRQLAFEFGPSGVTVNAVCPSQTMTDMLRDSMSHEQVASLEASIPLRRVAEVHEQVEPVLFLCSEGASYLNGAIIDVNGGQI